MNIVRYRLAGNTGGRGYYGEVELRVDEAPTDVIEVSDATPESLTVHGEVNSRTAPEVVAAAMDGARLMGAHLVRTGALAGARIVIRHVHEFLVDTRPSHVKCAAALAVWNAIIPSASPPPVAFVNGECQIHGVTDAL